MDKGDTKAMAIAITALVIIAAGYVAYSLR